MAVSRKVDLKKILLGIWKMIQSCISFLTTLIIVISIAITVLFLAKIKPYVVITGSINQLMLDLRLDFGQKVMLQPVELIQMNLL